MLSVSANQLFKNATNSRKSKSIRLAATVMLLAAQVMPLAAMAAGTPQPSAPVQSTSKSSTSASGSSSSKSLNLNLSSTQASVAAAKPGTILIGGQLGANGQITGATPMSVTKGMLLTPAENAALWQAVSGSQHLLLGNITGNYGSATGGSANVNSTWAGNLASLVVPQGVSVDMIGFNTSKPLNVAGVSSIVGSVYTTQTTAGATAALNIGNNLNISAGGLLSGSLPVSLAGLSTTGLFASQNMNLNVAGNFTNNGMVTVPGNLNLNVGGTLTNATVGNVGAGSAAITATIAAQNINITSGSGYVVNSGLMSALNNININTASPMTNLSINNTGGTMQALNAINVRDQLYTGAANLNLQGGNWFSQELNLYGGRGAVSVDVGELTGIVNTHAGSAHLSAITPDLHMGVLDVSGDPFVSNNGGDLDLSAVTFPAPYLVATAAGSIYTSSSSTDINTSSASGNGGNVVLAAGVTSADDSTGSITLARSGIGGDIFLTAGTTASGNTAQNITGFETNSSQSGSNGGNVTLIAMTASAGGDSGLPSGNTGGHIFLPANVQISSQGAGIGTNGNVTMIAEATEPVANAISTGSIGNTSTVFGTGGGGDINIKAATPNLAGVSISDSTGAVTGSFDSTNYQNGNINLGGQIVSPATTTVAGGSITAQSDIAGTDVNLTSTPGTGGNITLNGNLTGANTVALAADGNISLSPTGSVNSGTSILLQSANVTLNTGSVMSAGTSIVASGNLINNGTVEVISSDPAVNTGSIVASSIVNGAGAAITSVAPTQLNGSDGTASTASVQSSNNLTIFAGSFANAGTVSSSGSLSIMTLGSIVNAASTSTSANSSSNSSIVPTISASADLNLVSGTGAIQNAGTLSSSNGNVNLSTIGALQSALSSQAPTNSTISTSTLTLDNTGGTISAVNGNINFNYSSASGTQNVTVSGGTLTANNLNFFAGCGAVEVSNSNLSGQLNMIAGSSNVQTSGGVLTIGNNQISGDPVFISNGSIVLNGITTVGNVILTPGDSTNNSPSFGGIDPTTLVYNQNAQGWQNYGFQLAEGQPGGDGRFQIIAAGNITAGAGASLNVISGTWIELVAGGNIDLTNNKNPGQPLVLSLQPQTLAYTINGNNVTNMGLQQQQNQINSLNQWWNNVFLSIAYSALTAPLTPYAPPENAHEIVGAALTIGGALSQVPTPKGLTNDVASAGNLITTFVNKCPSDAFVVE